MDGETCTVLANDIIKCAHLEHVLRETWPRTGPTTGHEISHIPHRISGLSATGKRTILWRIRDTLIGKPQGAENKEGREKRNNVSLAFHDTPSSRKGEEECASHVEQEFDRLVGMVEAGAQGAHDILPGVAQIHGHDLVDVGFRDSRIRR